MSTPTKEEILSEVKDSISKFANYPVSDIDNDMVLKKNPLKMSSIKLTLLAMRLRAYIKNYNESETILSKEVKKKGITVKSLGELVHKKINS